MATYTKNLNLAMPGYEDAADIAVLNQNAQKLDEQVLHWNMAPYPATAALTPAGALELTGSLPADKDGLTVQFVSPAAATDGLQMKFAGSDTLYPILTTGEGKEPISAGAWDQGVPVTLTVSGGSCYLAQVKVDAMPTTGGEFTGPVTMPEATISGTPEITQQKVRNIYAGTADMTAGSSALPTGTIYLMYQ
jgi:hypothetical protein